ncbi:hypothetical protein AC579_4865 [Pseudocercospora musae]|uniref:Ubiquitin-like domain-containing protein n=1 Tax=Pseudocercospora musae TaxID=113226 RepID=A0A139IKQ7_9PEZI|nr:hypothetical protein AC579_4865 [Pseudocercospora musae]
MNATIMEPPDVDAGGDLPPPPPADIPERPSVLVTITFRDHRGFEQSFKLKTSTRLGKAMDAFSAKVERDRKALRFLFDGDRILDESTVEGMGMEDGDAVDVVEEQIGGES